MTKLNFDYDTRRDEQVAYYGSYTVRMVHDDCAINPFEDWDGLWPMIVRYDGQFTEYGDIPCPFDYFTDGQIIRHQKAILAALGNWCMNSLTGIKWSLESDFKEHMQNYCLPGDDRAEAMRDYFRDCLNNIGDSDKFETLAELFTLAGIGNLCAGSSGYCQSHYAELLIIASPESAKKFGCKLPISASDLKSQAKLYGYWAWGDVYGYIVERNGEEIDSCWGYYGDDPNESGLAEASISAIEYDMQSRRKSRLNKLRELIRSHVPLGVRQSILSDPDYSLT